MHIQANGTVSASQLIQIAQMAIDARWTDIELNGKEFPFPVDRFWSIASLLAPEVQNLSKLSKTKCGDSPVATSAANGPRSLLVDDNKINLQLLQTLLDK